MPVGAELLAAGNSEHPGIGNSTKPQPRPPAVNPDPRRRRSPPAGSPPPDVPPLPPPLSPSGGTGRLCAVDLLINGHRSFPLCFENPEKLLSPGQYYSDAVFACVICSTRLPKIDEINYIRKYNVYRLQGNLFCSKWSIFSIFKI